MKTFFIAFALVLVTQAHAAVSTPIEISIHTLDECYREQLYTSKYAEDKKGISKFLAKNPAVALKLQVLKDLLSSPSVAMRLKSIGDVHGDGAFIRIHLDSEKGLSSISVQNKKTSLTMCEISSSRNQELWKSMYSLPGVSVSEVKAKLDDCYIETVVGHPKY